MGEEKIDNMYLLQFSLHSCENRNFIFALREKKMELSKIKFSIGFVVLFNILQLFQISA